MHANSLPINSASKKIVLWKINKHLDFVPQLLEAASQFDYLPLRTSGTEVIDDE